MNNWTISVKIKALKQLKFFEYILKGFFFSQLSHLGDLLRLIFVRRRTIGTARLIVTTCIFGVKHL